MNENRKYYTMIDITKGICIIMVILTHVSTIPNDTRKLILYPFTILSAVPVFLILSGFSFSMSEELMIIDKSPYDISRWFEKKRFIKRLKRFLIPYFITCFLILLLLILLCNIRWFSFETLWKMFIMGGRGPGGNYVIILLELLVIFPFLLYGLERNPFVFSLVVLFLYCL